MINIVTVNKNNLSGLIRTADSILCQTDLNFRWTIVDGNSTDGSIDYINNLQFKNLLAIIEEDEGIYDAMNKGIEQSDDDDLVWFVNSGDLIGKPTVVSKLYSIKDSCDIIFGNYQTYSIHNSSRISMHNPEYMDVVWLFKKTINHQSYMIKGSLLKKNKFITKYTICADWVQLFRVLWLDNDLKITKTNEFLSVFEIGGLSSKQDDLRLEQRTKFLSSFLSPQVFESLERSASIISKNEFWDLSKIVKGRYRWSILKLLINVIKYR